TESFIAAGITVHNCSEYMFLDDTACNLASLNVLTFFDSDSRRFDIEAYKHGIRLWTIVLEISVLMASFPSESIAKLSYKFRTLGLGYANLGAMLMHAGIPYDSDQGRSIWAALTSSPTRDRRGYRNDQTTVIAPTGTIGLLMDCDTTGVEPDFALVKFKKLAGGGYFKIANQSLRPALQNLGYDAPQIHDILKYVLGSLSLHDAPYVNWENLLHKGFTEAE